MSRVCCACDREKGIQVCLGNTKEKDLFEDLNVNEGIILK